MSHHMSRVYPLVNSPQIGIRGRVGSPRLVPPRRPPRDTCDTYRRQGAADRGLGTRDEAIDARNRVPIERRSRPNLSCCTNSQRPLFLII